MLTINQKLAADVYRKTENLLQRYPLKTAEGNNHPDKKKHEKFYKQYGAMAHKLPVLIHSAGLSQALGFVEAKAKRGDMLEKLLNDLSETLGALRQERITKERLLSLSRGSNNQNLADYLLLTRQTQAALLWYKRFAQSVLGVEAGEDAPEDIETRQ